MSTKKAEVKKAEVKTAVKTAPAVNEEISFTINFPDGTTLNGSTSLREFQPNVKNGVRNSGFQCKIASGNYSGSLMIIDYLRQKRI